MTKEDISYLSNGQIADLLEEYNRLTYMEYDNPIGREELGLVIDEAVKRLNSIPTYENKFDDESFNIK